MNEKLLNCPFCGGEAEPEFNSLYGDMSMATCKVCGATAYAAKWNKRAPPCKEQAFAIVARERARCQKICDDVANEELERRQHYASSVAAICGGLIERGE